MLMLLGSKDDDDELTTIIMLRRGGVSYRETYDTRIVLKPGKPLSISHAKTVAAGNPNLTEFRDGRISCKISIVIVWYTTTCHRKWLKPRPSQAMVFVFRFQI